LEEPIQKCLYNNKFPRLTRYQKYLLCNIVQDTLNKGGASGEFWWRTDPLQPMVYTNIRPKTIDGNLDFNNPAIDPNNLPWVSDMAQMEILDKFGYLHLSPEMTVGTNQEKWRRFAVTQQGIDLFIRINSNSFIRFIQYIWDITESHLLSLFFGICGAILIELAILLLHL
jgi:hypothetical protein